MAAGLGHLGIPAKDFWSMTPRELSAALGPLLANMRLEQPPSRNDLDTLIRRFPD